MDILLVEDQVAAAEALQSLLEEDGHRVVIAPTFRAALAVLEGGCFDTALLDVKLPDGNGKELVSIVKSRCPEAKVYLATGSSVLEHTDVGYQFEDTVAVAREVGADGCLSKPIDYDSLCELLRS